MAPANPIAAGTGAHILAFRQSQATAWEQDLFKQKKRLADGTRSLQAKETEKTREEVRIATDKPRPISNGFQISNEMNLAPTTAASSP